MIGINYSYINTKFEAALLEVGPQLSGINSIEYKPTLILDKLFKMSIKLSFGTANSGLSLKLTKVPS